MSIKEQETFLEGLEKFYGPIEQSGIPKGAAQLLRQFGIKSAADLQRRMLDSANGAKSPQEAAKKLTEKLMAEALAKESC